jgi:AcrR family transcriptional regulator
MAATGDRVKNRPGGRSARLRDAVFAAVREEMIECGYAGLTIEAIAARAGVNRTTIYRRWGDKPGLVVDVLLDSVSEVVPMPDTGSIDDDLVELLREVTVNITESFASKVIHDVIAQMPHVPELKKVVHEFWGRRFELNREVIIRAIKRGDLPVGTDPDLLIEMSIGPLYLRLLVTGKPIDGVYAERVALMVLAAVRSGMPAPVTGG